jgi:hypothetical protein
MLSSPIADQQDVTDFTLKDGNEPMVSQPARWKDYKNFTGRHRFAAGGLYSSRWARASVIFLP